MATVSEVTTLPAELRSTLDLGHDVEKKEADIESKDHDSISLGQVAESENNGQSLPTRLRCAIC